MQQKTAMSIVKNATSMTYNKTAIEIHKKVSNMTTTKHCNTNSQEYSQYEIQHTIKINIQIQTTWLTTKHYNKHF